MTATVPETMVDQSGLIDLIKEVNHVISRHEAGSSFRLLFAPVELRVADDEIFVQTVSPEGVVELRPRKIAELGPDDIIHATQSVDPGDAAFYAARGPHDRSCIMVDGRHYYVV
ncbi:hypothetical protein ACFRKB_12120 [Streptomyces scopuliridis]|uniref:hypothetical protein n=1 Tax=Streptomyces scopuliridis TaxID=452529 RepID=UPI0036C3C1D5